MADDRPFLSTVYYLGCWGRSGHYLFMPGRRDFRSNDWHRRMELLDGGLAPLPKDVGGAYEPEFKAKAWRLNGYTPVEYSALSWWDRSVDRRHASNSIMFVPGHTVSAETMLLLASQYFPEVMGRLPPIELLPGVHEKTHASLAALTKSETPSDV